MGKRTLVMKIMAVTLAAVMAAGVTGCGGSKGKNSSAVSADGTINTSKHEVINMLVLGNKPSNGRMEKMIEKLNEILTEKVNAELKLSYVEWANWQTQYNVQLLSGDTSLDIITTATDWLYAWENTQKGAFMPLSEEMLQTYAPETYEQVAAKDDWKYCKYNGEIYFIPEDNYTQYTNQGIFYRGDWAKEAGIPDGDMKEFGQLTDYFQWIKENKPDTVPWDVPGKTNVAGILGGYLNSKSDNITIPGVGVGNFELFMGKSKEDPFTVTSPYMEGDEIYDGVELLKQWGEAGFWREDVLNYDGNSREGMYAGTSGADAHHSQTYYNQVKMNMDSKQPGSDVRMYYFGKENQNVSKPLKTHGAAAVSANSLHPERALMVYDLLRNNEECYRLINYGIEGEDYILTEDGKLDRPEGWDQSKDKLDANFWCGRNDELELVDISNWNGAADMIADYETFAYENPYTGLIVDKNKIEAQMSSMANVLSEYIPQLAFGKYDDPKAKVDEMRKKLQEAGYEEVKASIQADMDAYKAVLENES